MIKTILKSTAALVLSAGFAFGQGVPTADIKNHLETIKQFEQQLKDYGIQNEQLSQLVQQVEKLEEQLQQLEEIYALLTDPSKIQDLFMGGKLDGILKGDFNGSIVNAITAGSSGDWSSVRNPDTRKNITEAYKSAGTSQEEISAMANSDNKNAQRLATTTTSNAVTSAAAQSAYENAGAIRERASIIVQDIGKMKSVKESMDHNTRATAELAIVLAALLEVESAQTMNVGLTGVADAATIAETQKFFSHKLPD